MINHSGSMSSRVVETSPRMTYSIMAWRQSGAKEMKTTAMPKMKRPGNTSSRD